MRSSAPVTLNEEQTAVVNAINGVYAVIAGPGTGKTETLIRRHLSMLMAGIPDRDILNLTFTNAGAVEMIKRVGLLNAENLFRTFHSFAIEILKKERDYLPFKLCDTVIPVDMEDYKLLFELTDIYPAINWRTLKEKITQWKCSNILPDQAIEEGENCGVEYFYGLAYNDYEIRCREAGWLDFDSLMRETVALFESNEEVRNRWKRKYISIDECQDTDIVQARLIELIFDDNLMCIGDLNQAVYEWRSAAPDSLTKFVRSLPGAKTLFLGKNYRSTKALVRYFKKILPEDTGLASHMVTDNEEGIDPVFKKYEDAEEEANEILKLVTDPVNTAIIARTNRQLFTFQRICMTKGIKYKILGKRDLFEQNEVKKLLSLAKESKDTRPANVVLSDLIQQHNLLNLYRHSGKPTESNPIENLHSLVKMAAGKGNIEQFLTYFRKLTGARRSNKGLTLSTGHQIKGREASHIFLVGCTEGVLPHKNGEIREEERIFYVCCTRAKKTLVISYYKNPSRFIERFIKDESGCEVEKMSSLQAS